MQDNTLEMLLQQRSPNPNALAENFNRITNSVLESIAPTCTRLAVQRTPRPWLHAQLRAERTHVRSLERKWLTHPSEESAHLYKSARKAYYSRIDVARQSYLQRKISSQAKMPKQLFTTLNNLLGTKARRDEHSTNPNLTANDLASFFNQKSLSIAESIRQKIQTLSSSFSELTPVSITGTQTISQPQLIFAEVSEADIEQIISTSRPTTCPQDPFPSFLYPSMLPLFISVITRLVNSSLLNGIFPDCFKHATLCPILKKPTMDPMDCASYRPVSLLPFLSKILERTVLTKLTSHLLKHKVYDPFQSGFRPNHSTETALNHVLNEILMAKAHRQTSVLILLDLSSAFDTLDHHILMSRLKSLGIMGTPLSWFKSFLTGRSFSVSFQGRQSNSFPLSIGVPQGAVLSPLLFSLYTLPLGSLITREDFQYHMYADDIQIFKSFKSPEPSSWESVSKCLSIISDWLLLNHLKLNTDKTEILVFKPDRIKTPIMTPTIQVQDQQLVPALLARNLGVQIDDRLSLQTFIETTARTCNFHLANIRKIRNLLSLETARTLVQTLVISRLNYCNSLLAGLPQCSLLPLTLTQNTAVRVVLNLPRFAHISIPRKTLNWLPIRARAQFKILIIAFKALRLNTPSYLSSRLAWHRPVKNLRSRDKALLEVPATRGTNSRMRAFQCIVPQLWNALPLELRLTDNLLQFRKGLKIILFEAEQ